MWFGVQSPPPFLFNGLVQSLSPKAIIHTALIKTSMELPKAKFQNPDACQSILELITCFFHMLGTTQYSAGPSRQWAA